MKVLWPLQKDFSLFYLCIKWFHSGINISTIFLSDYALVLILSNQNIHMCECVCVYIWEREGEKKFSGIKWYWYSHEFLIFFCWILFSGNWELCKNPVPLDISADDWGGNNIVFSYGNHLKIPTQLRPQKKPPKNNKQHYVSKHPVNFCWSMF